MVRRLLSRFIADQSGATAIEYAMIAVGISVAIVATVAALADAVKGKFDLIESVLG